MRHSPSAQVRSWAIVPRRSVTALRSSSRTEVTDNDGPSSACRAGPIRVHDSGSESDTRRAHPVPPTASVPTIRTRDRHASIQSIVGRARFSRTGRSEEGSTGRAALGGRLIARRRAGEAISVVPIGTRNGLAVTLSPFRDSPPPSATGPLRTRPGSASPPVPAQASSAPPPFPGGDGRPLAGGGLDLEVIHQPPDTGQA